MYIKVFCAVKLKELVQPWTLEIYGVEVPLSMSLVIFIVFDIFEPWAVWAINYEKMH